MRAVAMWGRFGKERNLPGSAIEYPGMRQACVAEAATRYSCARGWHSAGNTDRMSVACETYGARVSGFEVEF